MCNVALLNEFLKIVGSDVDQKWFMSEIISGEHDLVSLILILTLRLLSDGISEGPVRQCGRKPRGAGLQEGGHPDGS